MFKPILTIFFWVTLFILGGTQGWSAEDMEDRFISPDISTSKNIFIDVKDVSLIDVLKIFSKQTGLSFIAAQDVQDIKLTLYLNKVPLNQALEEILDAYDLTYQMQEDNNVFVVTKKKITGKTKITKVYQLKYATVTASKLYSTLGTGTTGGSGGATAGGLEDAVKNALSADGKVIEDTRTNSLIITDVPAQFEFIESTIAKLDVPIPQILIEVEMLDVSKSVADQLGITYGSNPLSFVGGGSKVTNFPFGPTAAGGATATSASTGATGWSAAGMTAELNWLTTNTDARTLARPRILTLNNATAEIEISTDQAISIQSVASSTTTGSSTNTVTPERYTTGVILKVTPQANLLTREITMAVSPKVIDVILSQVQQTGEPPIYDPETRGSDSILKLRDGQSMVIGGLMNNQNNSTSSKVPILGDLPIVGAAFRSVNRTKTERELIIFLTPHIIDDVDQSALKANSSSSVQTALDIQNAADRAQEINNNLNNFDMK